MVIDTSALVAILADEAEARSFSQLIANASHPCMSAVSYLEASMVLGPKDRRNLPDLIEHGHVTVVPLDLDQARLAVEAHERYGRGSGSRARLNFGDCLVYALAKSLDLPLLFKGGDFAHTDVRAAH